jgi:hypothetical protein
MASIKGDIGVMPVFDLPQWLDMSRKTGTINANFSGIEKKIYLEAGRIVYVSSNKEGERLGEYIISNSQLGKDRIKSVLVKSQAMKIPFTQMLIDLNYFTAETLTVFIATYAKELLVDAVTWKDGWFEFIQDALPTYVTNGPIQLNTTELILKTIKHLDEASAIPVRQS